MELSNISTEPYMLLKEARRLLKTKEVIKEKKND